MRPLPGMVGLISSSSKVQVFLPLTCGFFICVFSYDISKHFQYLEVIEVENGNLKSICFVFANDQDKKKTTPVKQSDVKRTRRDRGELEDIMFKLFERQPNWTLKQLVQETDQPAVRIELLSFIS